MITVLHHFSRVNNYEWRIFFTNFTCLFGSFLVNSEPVLLHDRRDSNTHCGSHTYCHFGNNYKYNDYYTIQYSTHSKGVDLWNLLCDDWQSILTKTICYVSSVEGGFSCQSHGQLTPILLITTRFVGKFMRFLSTNEKLIQWFITLIITVIIGALLAPRKHT